MNTNKLLYDGVLLRKLYQLQFETNQVSLQKNHSSIKYLWSNIGSGALTSLMLDLGLLKIIFAGLFFLISTLCGGL